MKFEYERQLTFFVRQMMLELNVSKAHLSELFNHKIKSKAWHLWCSVLKYFDVMPVAAALAVRHGYSHLLYRKHYSELFEMVMFIYGTKHRNFPDKLFDAALEAALPEIDKLTASTTTADWSEQQFDAITLAMDSHVKALMRGQEQRLIELAMA
jgi:hypothetical protein